MLDESEALLLKAKEDTLPEDHCGKHKAGEMWMIRGPRDYIPSTKVIILENRKSIPLDKNEGIYVKNRNTGEVRSVVGETYLLNQNEELWEKHVSPIIESVLSKGKH